MPPEPGDAKGRAIVFLEPAGPIKDFDPGVSSGILQRELVRQAFLIAARDAFGLATRDGSLREPCPPDLPEKSKLRLITHFDQKAWRFSVERGSPTAPEVLLKFSGSDPPLLKELVERAEGFSRKEFVDALKKAGFTYRANPVKASLDAPKRTAERLAEMNFISQFAALRDLHEAVRTKGESPRLLGALACAYANLGVLTELNWSAAHKVFKARALLYAQRLVAREPKAQWGLWHRAYAEALAGLSSDAEVECIQLGQLEKEAPTPRGQRPPWADLIGPLCTFDPAKLEEAGEDAGQAQLVQLLYFLTVEHPVGLHRTLRAARAVLKDNPECFRVQDSISEMGGVNNQQPATLAGYRLLWKSLRNRLPDLPGLPAPVAKLLDDGAKEPEVLNALVDSGHSDRGAAEPSWAALGRVAQETRFVQVYRRLSFMHYVWVVPVNDFLNEAEPLVAGHPFAPLVRSFALEADRDNEEYLKLLKTLPLDDLDYNQTGILRAFLEADPKGQGTITNRAVRRADHVSRDAQLILRSINDREPIKLQFARWARGYVSENIPSAAAVIIDHDWPAIQILAPFLVDSQHPVVLLALARRFNALGRRDLAEACLKRCIDLSPDMVAYRALAQVYKDQGNTDRWQETLETFLENEEDHGLDYAHVQVELARHFMDRKEWKKALPYAEAAAESGAAWALECASDCYAGLEDWDRSEKMIRTSAERYPYGRYRWFYWCKRTGKGDLVEARKLVERHLENLGDRWTVQDVVEFGTYQMLNSEPKKALETFANHYRSQPSQQVALFAITLSDELGDKKRRDNFLKQFPAEEPSLKPLADLFAGCLAKGEPSKLDVKAVEAVLKGLPEDMQGDACYFIGRFMGCRGDADTATRYLRRCTTAKEARSPQVQVLAEVELRARAKATGKPHG